MINMRVANIYIYDVKKGLIVIIFLSSVCCFTYAIMDEFYLSLLSDSSMDIFPKNKQLKFHKS